MYRAPSGLSPQLTHITQTTTELLVDGDPPTPSPKPLGEPCGGPQVADVPVPDAPPGLDVREAWLDADDANLYATIRVADLPDAAPDGTVYRWSFHWRVAHAARFARASLDDAGTWSFDYGPYNERWINPATVTGETRTGAEGLIRIAVPRTLLGYRDGAMLRDTGAFSWTDAPEAGSVPVDRAPPGADPTHPSGGDYEVGRC